MINEIQRSITQLVEGRHLSRDETARAFQIMMMGGATPAQMAALLVGLRIKGETVEEITGAALAMRAKMETIAAPPGAVDVCGMGGDARSTGGTLNVSSAVALVVAGCGVPVVKHGNKSVSSTSGSADVFTVLGVNVQAEKRVMEKALGEANIAFLFAPLYHKATRHVAPVRQELGLRTIFNMLGPLANPAKPVRQLMGVYDRALLEPMAQVLRELGSEIAWVVHGSDGMDELTITGESYVTELRGADMRSFTVTPEEAGLERAEAQALVGTTVEGNARELGLLLHGKRSAYRDIVLLNAAAALIVAGRAASLREGAQLAAIAIDEGHAKEALANLIRITQAI
jgi:anthranilate phosphoribosyltransferase